MFKRVMLGTDPEFAIIDNETGKLVSAGTFFEEFFKIRGISEGEEFTIADPKYKVNKARYLRTTEKVEVGRESYEVPALEALNPGTNSNYGDIVVDGVAVEIKTNPVTCRNHFVMGVGSTLTAINEMLKDVKEWKDLKLSITPAVMLEPDELKALPKEGQVFGCNPDIPIYGGDNCQIVDAKEIPIRSFGGHIHTSFGTVDFSNGHPAYTNESLSTTKGRLKWYAENYYRIATLFDRIVGITSTAISFSELEVTRRSIYGQAGKIRIQPYGGLEYRTPSNAWLMHPILVNYFTMLTQIVNNLIFHEELEEEIKSLAAIEDVVQIINTSDSTSAMELFNNTAKLLQQVSNLSQGYHRDSSFTKIPQYMHDNGGVHSVVGDTSMDVWTSEGLFPPYGELANTYDFDNLFN